MSTKEARNRAQYKYAAANLKRVPLDLQKSVYDSVKASADAAGQSVNGYIKQAIGERQAREAASAQASDPPDGKGGEIDG